MSLNEYKERAAALLEGTDYIDTLQRVKTKEGLVHELRQTIGALPPTHQSLDHLKVLRDLVSVSAHLG